MWSQDSYITVWKWTRRRYLHTQSRYSMSLLSSIRTHPRYPRSCQFHPIPLSTSVKPLSSLSWFLAFTWWLAPFRPSAIPESRCHQIGSEHTCSVCNTQSHYIVCRLNMFPATPWFAHTQTTHPNKWYTDIIYLSPEDEWKHWLYAVILTLSFQDLGLKFRV